MANKYGNKKKEFDGHVFDSIVEKKYYEQLKWLKENNQISSFKLQPKYLLQGAFEKDGKKHRAIYYIADFEVQHNNGSIECIDIKGAPPTEAFKIKRKLFEKIYPHKLSILAYSKKWGGWLEYEELERLRKANKKEKKK